jgi:hypothetical protein
VRLAVSVLIALAAVPLIAAAPPVTDQSARMAPLKDLIGEWTGQGWMMLPNGQRATFRSQETVSSKLGGSAVLVEGMHRDAGTDQVVHNAMAMITWDERTKSYRFRSALSSGLNGDFPMEVSPGRFVWRVDMPGAKMEYVAEFTADRWVEKGRRIGADGKATDVFEMILTKR